MGMKCSKNGCLTSDPVKWIPVLNVWPEGYSRDGTDPAKIILRQLVLCDTHKKEADPMRFLTGDGWNMVEAHFKQNGFGKPVMDTIELSFLDGSKHNG